MQHRNPLGLHDLGLKTNVAVLFQGSMRHQWLCDCGESPSVTCTIFCKRGHIIFQMPANIVTLFYFFPRCEVLDVEKCGFDNITRIWGLKIIEILHICKFKDVLLHSLEVQKAV